MPNTGMPNAGLCRIEGIGGAGMMKRINRGLGLGSRFDITAIRQDTYKVRSAKMRKCENGQRIQCETKCEVVFAFYALQRISCEVEKMQNATI